MTFKIKFFVYIITIILSVLFLYSIGTFNILDSKIDYNTQVKPILNKRCISCHGGVKQSGGFSLMSRSSALKINESGVAGIVPGKPDQSEMIRRINLSDPDERMPYEAPPLSKEEKKILTTWIEQGAEWGLHWAYQPLEPKQNNTENFGLFSNDNSVAVSKKIDFFVKEKLTDLGLSPSKPATKPELLRRVSLDIIGIPAEERIKQDFLNGTMSYESLVDSLLNMDAFGEKWASMWLDIARYADSKGYEKDENRSIWPYRDYVIKSFNSNKPYDQFIIEQLAGDMLDLPTEEQYIATGFHRNTTTNDEGGTNNEEFRVKAVIDRVATTWEGIMGTTMACVQCHGHPYDPISHEEFYQSFALFNNTRDADTYFDYPQLKFLDTLSQQKLDSLKTWIENVAGSEKSEEIDKFILTIQPVIYSIETDQLEKAALYDTKFLGLRKDGVARIPELNLENKPILLMRARSHMQKGLFTLHLNKPNGPVIGKLNVSKLENRYGLIEVPLDHNGGIHDVYLHFSTSSSGNKDAAGLLIDWFYFTQEFPGKTKAEYLAYKNMFYDLLSTSGKHTLIMVENPPDRQRSTHIFDRGNWLVPTKEVQPGIPEVLEKSEKPVVTNRLNFAQWIVSEENPLTARTFVNRVWGQLFGTGIVSTTEDLGSQGENPTHPELLNFLSYQWMHQQGWKVKNLIKSIVSSDTYCQSAKATPLLLDKDPYNKYLSRGPRIRLSAEQIRDQALFVSGLLSRKMYGAPVMPFQPEGIWQTPYNNQQWHTSQGEDRYRRSLYTMIKRSSIYPSLETFDYPQRLVCTSRRIRTNTPLQALVTLNDPVFLEASEFLADRMLKYGGVSLSDKINYAYDLAMSGSISKEKSEILEDLYYKTIKEIELQNFECAPDTSHLALSIVANAILNLDELINK